MRGPGAFVVGILAILALSAVACSGGKGAKADSPTPTPGAAVTPGSPEDALVQYVQANLQKGFVPDCTQVDQSKDADKVCADFKGDRGSQKAYQLAEASGSLLQWAILDNQSGQWRVVSVQPINADNKDVPGIPWPLRTGVDVVVTGAAPCLNVREGPALNQKAVDCIKDGATIRLAAGPSAGDNMQWWQVEGRTGWVAGDYLRFPDARQ